MSHKSLRNVMALTACAAAAGVGLIGAGVARCMRYANVRKSLRTHTAPSLYDAPERHRKIVQAGNNCGVVVRVDRSMTISRRSHREIHHTPPMYVGGKNFMIPIGGTTEKITVVDEISLTPQPSEFTTDKLSLYPSANFVWQNYSHQLRGNKKFQIAESTVDHLWFYGTPAKDGKFAAESGSDCPNHLIESITYEETSGLLIVLGVITLAILLFVYALEHNLI